MQPGQYRWPRVAFEKMSHDREYKNLYQIKISAGCRKRYRLRRFVCFGQKPYLNIKIAVNQNCELPDSKKTVIPFGITKTLT